MSKQKLLKKIAELWFLNPNLKHGKTLEEMEKEVIDNYITYKIFEPSITELENEYTELLSVVFG